MEKMSIGSSVWYKPLIMADGRLDDTKTKSEYERGFIDCWNELWEYSLYV